MRVYSIANAANFKCMILPRKSNLVLLTDTGAGLVGADVLNSLVGVSCCNETEQWGLLLLYLTRSLMNQLLKVWEIPDQKGRSWHHQKRTHFFLCPFLCPSFPWVISADSSGRRVCPRQFLWRQSPSGSFRPPARPLPRRQGRSPRTDLSVFRSDFQLRRRQILLYRWGWGGESEREGGGRGTDELVLLWKWKKRRGVMIWGTPDKSPCSHLTGSG